MRMPLLVGGREDENVFFFVQGWVLGLFGGGWGKIQICYVVTHKFFLRVSFSTYKQARVLYHTLAAAVFSCSIRHTYLPCMYVCKVRMTHKKGIIQYKGRGFFQGINIVATLLYVCG